MTETDLLKRAAKSLRETHQGQRAGSGFTRARIMKTLHQRRRQRLLWWSTLTPTLALLLGGSAWAQATGGWPKVWHSVSAVISVVARHDGVAPAEKARQSDAQPPPKAPHNPHYQPLTKAPLQPELEPPAVTEPDNPPQTSPAVDIAARPKPATRITRRAVARPTNTAVEPALPASDPELSQFRLAHDAHYAGRSPSGAIVAYESYLKRFPSGRFVPEARYNMALNLVKLGQKKRALKLLRPFAAGQYGAYRQERAKELIETLSPQ